MYKDKVILSVWICVTVRKNGKLNENQMIRELIALLSPERQMMGPKNLFSAVQHMELLQLMLLMERFAGNMMLDFPSAVLVVP